MSAPANIPNHGAAFDGFAKLIHLAIGIADDTARSDVESFAYWIERDGVLYLDTTKVADDGLVHDVEQELAWVHRAVQYIERRGDALPYRMQRHIDAPHLVCFTDVVAPAEVAS